MDSKNLPDEKKFKKMKLLDKFYLLRDHGEYCCSRLWGGYQVHLYKINDFFSEVWMRIDFGDLAWIEPISRAQITENYPELKLV